MAQLHRCRTTVVIISLLSVCRGATTGQGTDRLLCPPMPNVPAPPNRVNTTERLQKIRTEMRRVNTVQGPPLDAYIVPTHDDHQGEYVAERDERVRYISGFSGNSGVLVITMNSSALWTNGIYHLQADQELNCDWLLMGRGDVSTSITDWLKGELHIGSRVGADPRLVANSMWEVWAKQLSNVSIYLLPIRNNLVDEIWTVGRLNYTRHEAYNWPIEHAGKTWQSKVSAVRQEMKRESCDALVVTALDEIAWLLNMRGHDVPYNPLVRAYLVLTKDQLHLYADRLGPAVRRQLHTDACFSAYCARVHDYEAIWDDLRTLSQIWKLVWLPARTDYNAGVSRAIFLAIPVEKRKVLVSPIVEMKAEKNTVEREGMRQAHVRDGAALCDFLAYLQTQMRAGEQFDELKVSATLDQFRTEQSLSRGPSFASIVGFGPHGALPHYIPSNSTNIRVDNSSTLVIDSGGHYIDGTTDVTRTFHFGTPTPAEIEVYTRTLIGCIDVMRLTFPRSMPMGSVDILARASLWAAGLDYQHGTGHGIGAFLPIHEDPISLGFNHRSLNTFKEGYFFSVEPGYYKEGKFGVRLENIMEVVDSDLKNTTVGHFLSLMPVTLVPYEPKLINLDMLGPEHRQWLNKYNTKIRNEVGAELKKDLRMDGFYWMMENTKNVPEDCYTRSSANVLSAVSFAALASAVMVSWTT